MNFKKRGFSLIELLIVIAIFSVLLLIATDRFIIGAVKSNNNYNQEIDLQSGVKNSMDNIKNTLKKSVQVHLVGKEVYKPDMDLSKLDKNYNYIAFREDGGNKFLANLVYNRVSNQFDAIPLMAINKKDNLNNTDINYNLKFYEGNPNFKEKMEKNILTLTVEGISKVKDLQDKNSNIKKFELKEDFVLPNINQILISKHLNGNINDITAIAYHDSLIVPNKKRSISLVFVIDGSASMKHTMDNGYLFKYGNVYKKSKKSSRSKPEPEEYKLNEINKYLSWKEEGKDKNNSEYVTRKVLLEYALNDVFLNKFDAKAKEYNLDVSAYIFTYHHEAKHNPIDFPKKDDKDYFYSLDTLEDKKYGPYYLGLDDQNLNDVKTYVTDNLGIKFLESDHDKGGPVHDAGTNTGLGLLQGFEILKQLESRNREDRYLILLTDGDPTYYTVYKDVYGNNVYLTNRKDYNEEGNKNVAIDKIQNWDNALDYIRYVTDKNYNNVKGLYKTAYVIGFGNPSQMKKLGVTKVGEKVDEKDYTMAVPFFKVDSLGNPVPILTYDSVSKSFIPNPSSIQGITDENSKNIFNYLTFAYDDGNPNGDPNNPLNIASYNKDKLFELLTNKDKYGKFNQKDDPYRVFMADEPKKLEEALRDIVDDIFNKSGVFEGPDKMK